MKKSKWSQHFQTKEKGNLHQGAIKLLVMETLLLGIRDINQIIFHLILWREWRKRKV